MCVRMLTRNFFLFILISTFFHYKAEKSHFIILCVLSLERWMEEKIFIIEMYSIFILGNCWFLPGLPSLQESAKNDLCIKHLSIYFSDFLLGISVCQHPRKIILFLPVLPSHGHMEEFCVLLIMTMRGYEV